MNRNRIGKFLPVSLATMVILGAVALGVSANDSTTTTGTTPTSVSEMRNENRVAVQAALDANDYDAWVKAVSINGQLPEFLKVITKDNFSKYVEASNYRKQAMDLMKKSDDIMKELGVNPRPAFEKGEGHREGGRGWFGGKPKDDQAETEVK